MIEFFFKLSGHFDFDTRDPKNIKRIHVFRRTMHQTRIPEDSLPLGAGRMAMLLDIVKMSTAASFSPADVVSVSGSDESATAFVAAWFGCPVAQHTQADMANPDLQDEYTDEIRDNAEVVQQGGILLN